MPSSTMHEPLAIRLQNVSKIYKLHSSQRDQLVEVLGLKRFGFKPKGTVKEFAALSDISLDVPLGHRMGIIGRNGAGKTTLLKLLCGNFAPNKGTVEVNGTVQALMNTGLGFHPEYTGRDNVESALQYNGLEREEYRSAMDGIIEFCELGDFLDQPFKTYSLGMQARLMFAAATAINPDILIVDEVLGAGDAYFIAKSKTRVEKLVSHGCTMLLVSHSMQQVLELCDEAIWLDQGRIRMSGEAFLVVKAYEEYLHGPIGQVQVSNMPLVPDKSSSDLDETEDGSSAEEEVYSFQSEPRKSGLPNNIILQEPYFLPHGETPGLPNKRAHDLLFQAAGGVSRWDSDMGVKVIGFSVISERGISNKITAMRPVKFVFSLIAECDGPFSCRYGVVLHDSMGVCVVRILSPVDRFEIKTGEKRQVEMLLNPCQLGPGEYIVGLSVLDDTSIENINSSRRYDLLSRSFSVRVELPDSLQPINASFFHTAEWDFNNYE